jgi:uncharacterized membrane protein
MRILLLNDNPVVRKLVALSAQKTKDDLDVIWSLDEIEYPNYDLFIVDDALYSDEAMQQLKKKITFKSSLLMATRGASTPAGFDKVINKPFLPTDLVELFVGIANSLPSVNFDDPKGAIDVMDDVLDELLDDDMLTDDSQEYNLDDLIDEEIPLKTNILDSQEVQELQGLLDDTESDDNNELDGAEFEMLDIEETEDLGQESQGDFVPSLGIDELDELDEFNEEELNELKETQEDELSDDELEAMLLSGNVKSESSKEDDVDLEALLAEMSAEELLNEPMSDDDFEDLEQQIQEAMGNLEPEDLEQPLDAVGLDDLDFDALEDDLGILDVTDEELLAEENEIQDTLDDEINDDVLGVADEEAFDLDDGVRDEDEIQATLNNTNLDPLDDEEIDGLDDDLNALDMGELDGLDEREIRLAIGEEVEDEECEIRAGSGEHASLDVEALSEAMGKLPALALDELDLIEPEETQESSPAAGMEALQSLLKALSNDEVTKSLKGLNISININFGNDK